jgi:uncharacterized protein YcbK (DUF882 family)
MSKDIILTRRRFLRYTLQLTAGIALSNPFESNAATAGHPLSFYHTHTGERLRIHYSCNGCPPDDLKRLNTFLRDFRTGDVFPIDPGLLDILYGIQQESGQTGVVEIISGYRSPKTNDRLRSKSRGVAKKSLHMKGRALDIRVTGFNTANLRDTAVSLGKGGVGYYAKSDFVHIDTGRFRTW